MLGSTGSGKSTLSSFIYDPINYFNKPKFLRATSINPQTKHYQLENMVHLDENNDNYQVMLVDTPGLNEDKIKDVEHMISTIDLLKSIDNITCIIICINFSYKIDSQFRTTIEYYANLLKECIATNLLVVLTNVRMDDLSIRERNIDGININKNKERLANEIKNIAGLDFTPVIFTIDANPYYKDIKQVEQSRKKRVQLLDLICGSMSNTSVKELQFYKTPEIIIDDQKKLSSLRGFLEGYEIGLIDNFAMFKPSIDKISKLIKKRNKLITKISIVEEHLLEKNSINEQQINNWMFRKNYVTNDDCGDCGNCGNLGYMEYFELSSRIPISRCIKSKPINLQWKDLYQTGSAIKGSIMGNFDIDTEAFIIIYGQKKDIYADQIDEFIRQRNKWITQKESIDNDIVGIFEENKMVKEIINFKNIIKKIETKVDHLSKKSMLLDDALIYLKQMQNVDLL